MRGNNIDERSDNVGMARRLRRNQTEAERRLWTRLRNAQLDGVKFRRQEPLGKYIVDFVSFDQALIIEVDGGQHNEDESIEKDEERTKSLGELGFRVMRFWNNDVMLNMDGVLMRIREALEE